MASSWERNVVAKLIELYREHVCLYAVNSPNYHNKKRRYDALQDITLKVREDRPNTTLEDIKNKINGLRTQYMAEKSKEKKSKKSDMSAGEIYKPSLWCYRSLQFLEAHSKGRKGTSNIFPEAMAPEVVLFQRELKEEDDFSPVYVAVSEEDVEVGGPASPMATTSTGISTPALYAVKPSCRKRQREPDGCVHEAVINAASSTLQSMQGPKEISSEEQFGIFVGKELLNIQSKLLVRRAMLEIQKILLKTFEEDSK